jgi:hypothetical protein
MAIVMGLLCAATFISALPAQEGLYRNSHGLNSIGERSFSGTSQPEDTASVRNWAGLASNQSIFFTSRSVSHVSRTNSLTSL